MKNNALLNELKAATAPHVFRALNAATGINWEKPFTAEIITGNYTVKKLEKEAAAAGYDTRKDLVFILTKDTGSRYEREYNLVIIENGAANIERIYNSIYTNAGKYYSEPYSHFFRKGDFETTRKAATANTFLIMQAAEDISIKGGKARKSIPAGDRYKLVKEVKHGDGRGNTYTGKLELIRTTDHGSRATYEANPGRYINAREMWRPESAAEMIDKSGYLLHERREDLKRRANALRTERAKVAYMATDDAARVKELETLFEAKKREAARAILNAGTYEEMKAAEEAIDNYRTGLTWALYDLERYRKATAEKKYTSIEQATRAYEAIKAKLQPAAGTLDGIRNTMKSGFNEIAATISSTTTATAPARA